MDRRQFLILGAGLPMLSLASPPVQATFWARVFAAMPPELAAMAADPEYRVQILAQYRRKGSASWRQSAWQLTPERWFSIASVAKLPIALLACERFSAQGLDLDVQIGFSQSPIGGEWPADEPDFESLRRSLTRIFTISENPPFNRLYDFLGVDAMHVRLRELGYPDARLISRMSAPVRDNARTRAGELRSPAGEVLARFPERVGTLQPFPFGTALDGRGYIDAEGLLVQGPRDFSHANFIPLADALQMLRAIVDPASVPAGQRWAIAEPMRQQLLQIMAMLPRDSMDPRYDEAVHYDGYARFFLLGDAKARKPDALHLVGKAGEAYGFLSDVVHISEDGSPYELLLAANVHVNADGIYNDDVYEYETRGYPFLAALGRAVWQVVNASAG